MAGKYQAYPEYKDTGIPWLGVAPSDWSIHALKRSVHGCVNGVWGDEPNGASDITVLRVADFDRDKLEISDEKLTTRSIPVKDRKNRQLARGDLLIEKSGGGEKTLVGCVVKFDKDYPAVTSNFVAKMTPKAGFDSGFLTYAFAHLYAGRVNYPSIKQTTGIQNLDSDAYLMERFVFPSLAEQRTIAAFLDYETARIDRLIEKQQRLIELLKEKRQAVISHAVTKGLDPNVPMKDSGVEWLGQVPEHWDVCALSSVTSKITNGYVGPTRDIFVESGVIYLQSLHIKNNRIDFHTPYFVSNEWSRSKAKSILELGDVLIVQTGDIGQVACVSERFVGANCHALIIASPVDRLRGQFLSLVLNSHYGYHSLKSIQTGALHPHLNCNYVKTVKIPLPPEIEQDKILRFIGEDAHKYDCLIDKSIKATQLLRERRTALISAAVTGKIDVRNWQPNTSAQATELDLPMAAEQAAEYRV